MKSIRQSKNAYIQSLLVRGAKPCARVLCAGLSAEEARQTERRLIAESKRNAWNCNTADGGEGIVPGEAYSVYALCEPWEDGRVFYVGIAIDVNARLKQHIAEAKETCITLTKNPNLARFLADFLNGCCNTSDVLENHAHETPFKRFFFRTTADYLEAWAASGCGVEDTVRVGDWLMHGWLERQDFARIIAAFDRVGRLRGRRRSNGERA